MLNSFPPFRVVQSLITPIAALLILVGCASESTKPEAGAPSPGTPTVRQVALEARVQLQNKVERKTYTLVMEAIALEPSKMRVDLTGPFGSPMGKLVLRGDQVGILVPQQKKAYFGTASEQSFRPLIPLQLHPQSLLAVLLGEVPANWQCEATSETNQVCTDHSKALRLERDPRPEGRKSKLSIEGEKFALTMIPLSIKTNVQVKPETFSMPVPEGYSKYKIP